VDVFVCVGIKNPLEQTVGKNGFLLWVAQFAGHCFLFFLYFFFFYIKNISMYKHTFVHTSSVCSCLHIRFRNSFICAFYLPAFLYHLDFVATFCFIFFFFFFNVICFCFLEKKWKEFFARFQMLKLFGSFPPCPNKIYCKPSWWIFLIPCNQNMCKTS